MDGMRRGLLGGAVLGAMGLAGGARAQDAPASVPEFVGQDWADLKRYHDDNVVASALADTARRCVMMGDSITDNWARPEYSGTLYADNGLIGRGISGQVTAQMLIRFVPEVLVLRPACVHILAGTNDVAENTDPYDATATQNNLAAMGALARQYGIRVVMGSVPPATSFSWRPRVGNPVDKIRALNVWIRAHCAAEGYVYADYWPALSEADGSLKRELGIGGDSVHPNADGYALMAPVALAAVTQALA